MSEIWGVPDIVAENFKKGHDCKTSLMAGFKTGTQKRFKTDLRFFLCPFLQPCIQMDVDADDHSEERITFSGMDAHIMQVVIIEYPVVDSFTGSAVVVDSPIFLRTPWDRSIETDIPVRFCVDTPAIGRRGTFVFTGAGIRSATGKGAAPFAGMLLFTVAPVDHTAAGHAQGSAVFVNGDGIRDGFRPAAVTIQVNEGTNLPFPAEAIGGIVVIGGIQAEVTDRDIRVDGLEFAQGDNGRDTVVPPGIDETDMEREVNAKVRVMGAEHIKGMSEIKDFLVAVPSPVRIRVREMAAAGAVRGSVFQTAAGLMSVRGGMGMDTGAVTGKGQAVFWDEPILEGRKDCSKPEELLEPVLIMEGELLMGQGVSSDGFGNAGMLIRKLLPLARFFGRLFVPVSREKVLPAGPLQIPWLCPEPVHEVKIRPKGRQGTGSAADEDGKQAVGPELSDPGGKARKAEHHHKDKGTQDLGLVPGWASQVGIEPGKVSHDGIQVQQLKFFLYSAEFKVQPCAL